MQNHHRQTRTDLNLGQDAGSYHWRRGSRRRDFSPYVRVLSACVVREGGVRRKSSMQTM